MRRRIPCLRRGHGGGMRTTAWCSAAQRVKTGSWPSGRLDVAQQQFEDFAVGHRGETGTHGDVLAGRGEPDLDETVVGLSGFPCKFDGTDRAACGMHVL